MPAAAPGHSVALTNREQEVLELMALGLTNREIADQLVLSARTVEAHIEHLLEKLGVQNRTRAIIGAIHSGLLKGSSADTVGRRSNLPLLRTSFVGRTAELVEIKTLLGKHRLVTIVGAGGVGKTRVALRVGVESLDTFNDGVWLADLAKISGPHSVVPAIASAFGVKSLGFGTLEERLLLHLRSKRLLLILDNCEHVIVEAGRTVHSILATCPEVTVLATSRERLGEQGEHLYRLPSLDVPPPNAEVIEKALKFSAVALFVDRARLVDTHFELVETNARAIGNICQRLDGVALAIELAAARVTTLTPDELLERLRAQFRLLRGGDRAVHPRHRTMRATLDWSYDWLTDTEKAAFRRLAIFQGGWTVDTLGAAGLDQVLDEADLLDTLSSLVDKSLVTAELRGGAQRFRLMEPLRQYGLERLKESHEFEAVAAHHASYFTEFARQAASHWRTPSEPAALEKIEDEMDNIRAALEWALLQRHASALGAELATYLGNFWLTRHYHEGVQWLESAQAAISFEEHPALSGAVTGHLLRSYAQADQSKTLPLCEEAIPLLRKLDDQLPLRRTLFFYGTVLLSRDRLDDAEQAFQECLELCQRADDTYLTCWQLIFLGRMNTRRGQLERARELLTQGCEIYDSLGIPLDRNRWIAFAPRARLEQLAGHLDQAIALCREGLRITQLTQDPLGGMQIEYLLAAFLFLSGDDEEARTHGLAVLRVSQNELLPHGIAPAIQVLAGVATLRGRLEIAARLLGYVEMRFPKQAYPPNTVVEVDPQWFIGPLREHFGDSRLAELMAEGATWSEDRAIEAALTV
jgi:predicted ATPase/DNA-binding CsgD family transcriptional regulator